MHAFTPIEKPPEVPARDGRGNYKICFRTDCCDEYEFGIEKRQV